MEKKRVCGCIVFSILDQDGSTNAHIQNGLPLNSFLSDLHSSCFFPIFVHARLLPTLIMGHLMKNVFLEFRVPSACGKAILELSFRRLDVDMNVIPTGVSFSDTKQITKVKIK